MSIKDIVNRDIANLTNCESEPIHIPGTIQEHGFLLGLTGEDLTIKYCSANAHRYFNKSESQLLGHPLSEFTDEAELMAFTQYMASFTPESSLPFSFSFCEVLYNTNVHYSNDVLILECEPFPDGSLALPSLYLQTKKFVSLMESASLLQPLCQKIADETREITGYDRVMIYRFDKEYNGEVFAESKIEEIDSFLGHHYPHTDIPAQARELYMRNLMRMIVDVNYSPVPLLTIDDRATHKSLDLSLSVLRSVSPIHIQYLKNMGVGATLTISLINNKKLWGMISCHHYSPKNLPHYKRLAAQLQGHFLTSQINVREVAEEFEVNQRVDAELMIVLGQLYNNEHFLQCLCSAENLIRLCQAGGAVIANNGELYTCGNVPGKDELWHLINKLSATQPDTYNTDNLVADYPEFEGIADKASGIIYYNLGKSGCIFWMRPEIEKTINWAGDPDTAVMKDTSPAGLSPRKSFALWQQVVKNRSHSWCKGEINGCIQFATALQKQLHLIESRGEEERYRKINQKLKEANNELENINWISTHDLKEPLRKIQIFASKLLQSKDESLSANASDTIARMSQSAKRMQLLIDDILTFSHMNNTEQAFEKIDLNALLHEIKTTVHEELHEKNGVLLIGTLPTITAIQFQIRQLFINLINNSLKFTRQGISPIISISASEMKGDQIGRPDVIPDKLYSMISITDNGIGFENDYSERIFSVFQRLHAVKQYSGTGIGLAICKKIMDTHGGIITANGQPGDGATFNLYFPVHDEVRL